MGPAEERREQSLGVRLPVGMTSGRLPDLLGEAAAAAALPGDPPCTLCTAPVGLRLWVDGKRAADGLPSPGGEPGYYSSCSIPLAGSPFSSFPCEPICKGAP